MCGPLEEGRVKEGDSTGCIWDPGWAAAALCCEVHVVLGGLNRVPTVPGAAGSGADEGLVSCLCCGEGFLVVITAASIQEGPLGASNLWLQ